jgi:hypothetical protein
MSEQTDAERDVELKHIAGELRQLNKTMAEILKALTPKAESPTPGRK